MNIDISQIFITPRDTILDAIACIDSTIAKIALVVDQDQKLIDTITDGDVRRAILQNINLEESIDLLQDVKLNTRATGPISASPDTPDDTLKQIMQSQRIRQIPLIDSSRKVVGLDGHGLEIVEQLPIKISPNKHNLHYLKTKRQKMGHKI